jgi:hypothetical protein
LHSKLESPSLEEKRRVAEVAVVVAGGPLVIEVCGGVVSVGGGGGDVEGEAGSEATATPVALAVGTGSPVPGAAFGEGLFTATRREIPRSRGPRP